MQSIHRTTGTMQYCLTNARTLSTELLYAPEIQHAVHNILNMGSFENGNNT